MMANTRLPYASTLAQTDSELVQLEEPVPAGAGYPNGLALPGPNYGYPGMPTQSQIFADPENEWQDWAQDLVDWEDNQTMMANTRIPYASAFLQTDSQLNYDFKSQGSAIVDDIMDSVDDKDAGMESLAQATVPLDFHLLQTGAINDHPGEMENFQMEDPGIPLNMRI